MRRRLSFVMLALLTAGCAGQEVAPDQVPAVPAAASPTGASPDGTATGSPTGSPGGPSTGHGIRLTGEGTFKPFKEGVTAVVYDRKLVPSGAKGEVTVDSMGEQTVTKLSLDGMLHNRKYGAHLHVNACGEQPDNAGPHFRHEASPSASPDGTPAATSAANPHNEVWLDVTTDAEGDGKSKATQHWALTSDRLPGSLVIHAKPTTTTGPQAGEAGDRVACLTLNPSDD
jgi:Cu-Zn family superoxide dismutase